MTKLRLVPEAEANPEASVKAIDLETVPSVRCGLILELALGGAEVQLPGQSLVTMEDVLATRSQTGEEAA